jgi:signal transduction histidine kinase
MLVSRRRNCLNGGTRQEIVVQSRKQLIFFWGMVCLPLVVIAGLGWRLAHHEHDMARQRVQALLLVRLQDSARTIDEYFHQHERRLQVLIESVGDDPNRIRELVRRDPYVGQLFVVDASGALLHPNPAGAINKAERRFLGDFGELFLHNDLLPLGATGDDGAASPTSGWVVRFRGPGLNLLYCGRLPSGRLVGVLLERSRWIADLIAALPDTTAAMNSEAERARIRLVNSNGHAVYDWGSLEPNEDATPLQELAPSYPLSSWRLQHFVDDEAFATLGRGAYFNLLSILGATGLVLVMAGGWFYREYGRHVREATDRVSFVNQVSHELKTPLTNIRMYAELLENDLDEVEGDHPQSHRAHLKVIVEESQRLSRLIANVLTFAQKRGDQVALRLRPAVIDEVVARVLQRFDPTFQRRGLEVVFQPSAGAQVEMDVDALEQILGNLLSNVEKYASAGGRLEILTSQPDDFTSIIVTDDGPGIPARHRDRVFKPFQRLFNHIADSPGTGIGLTIARQLAQLHGGDLRLIPSASGACFEIRLHTPVAESEALS